MKKSNLALCSLLFSLSSLGLGGCVAEGGYFGAPAPYYGGAAPYYGTAYVPGYAYGGVGGGYYPYHRSANIYSGYNNHYWHYQHGVQGRPPSAPGSHGGGHGGPGGHR